MNAYRIRISLSGTDPLIWREITVPDGITFSQLHSIFQRAMGWEDRHGYFFSFHEGYTRITGIRDEYEEYILVKRLAQNNELNRENDPEAIQTALLQKEMRYAGTTRVAGYLDTAEKFTYVYDLGDHWVHDVEIIDIIEEESMDHPKLNGGAGKCPPEDIGGTARYSLLLKAKESGDPECLNLVFDLIEGRGTDYDPRAMSRSLMKTLEAPEDKRDRKDDVAV